MAGDEPPPLPSDLPPPLPVRRPAAPVPQPILPVAVVPLVLQPVAPVTAPSVAPLPASPAGKSWWVWCLAGGFACLVLFIVCLNCNPATTATDRLVGKVQAAVAQQIDPQLHPFLSAAVGFLFNKYLALTYAQMQAAGFAISFFACLLIPLGGSFMSAALGHPIFMLGGAPGGWRATGKSFGLHRTICDGASLLVLTLVLIVPMEPLSAAGIICALLPLIRVVSVILLWINLARAHEFGPLRIIFLGLPHMLIVSIFSGLLAFALGLYFYAYLVARSF